MNIDVPFALITATIIATAYDNSATIKALIFQLVGFLSMRLCPHAFIATLKKCLIPVRRISKAESAEEFQKNLKSGVMPAPHGLDAIPPQ